MAATGGDLCLYSLSLHPEGRPAMEKVERYLESYRALRRELEGSGVRLGVLVQSILGHWPRVDKDIEDWTRTVNIKGEKVRFCPDDPGFAKYIDLTFAMLAKERPAFILTDDDVRAPDGSWRALEFEQDGEFVVLPVELAFYEAKVVKVE